MDEVSHRAVKGRGAVSNRSSRFERESRVPVADGWSAPPALTEPPRTTVEADAARTVISRNDSPDLPFDQSVNPYRGCEHACIYCFARPSHAYLGLSPGLDFETRLFAKRRAAALLAAELRARSYRCLPLALGSNTDPYQPIERHEGITRGLLEVCRDFGQPLCITTKSALIGRDLDILAPMAALGLVSVAISVTTLDPNLARRLEPRAAAPAKRLETIARLAGAGIPVAVLASPICPGLNDHELERILEAAAAAGATRAAAMLLRLPRELGPLFEEWLSEHVPNRAGRVLSLLRQSRDGRINQSGFGIRMTGSGPIAELLARRFELACKRLALNQRSWDLECRRFKPPPAPGGQLDLFDAAPNR